MVSKVAVITGQALASDGLPSRNSHGRATTSDCFPATMTFATNTRARARAADDGGRPRLRTHGSLGEARPRWRHRRRGAPLCAQGAERGRDCQGHSFFGSRAISRASSVIGPPSGRHVRGSACRHISSEPSCRRAICARRSGEPRTARPHRFPGSPPRSPNCASSNHCRHRRRSKECRRQDCPLEPHARGCIGCENPCFLAQTAT